MTNQSKAILAAFVLVAGASAAIVLGAKQGKREVTIPAGTSLVATLEGEVSTKSSQPGNSVSLTTVEPILLGEEEIPQGVAIHGSVTTAEGGGRMAGAPKLGMKFTEIEVDGVTYPIQAKSFFVTGKSDAGESAAQGAVIGAVVGTGVAIATDGDDLYLRNGRKIEVVLAESVTVEFKPAPAPEESEG